MLIKFEVQIELPIIRLNSLLDRFEQVLDAVHSKRRLAKDAHDLEYWPSNLEVVLDDGNEAVSDDSHVYLYADCILALSPETLDLEVLLDPFEKQLHLPPVFIEQGDVLRTEVEVVRIVDEASVKLRRIIDNSSDNTWILLLILLLGEANGLVFEYIVCSVAAITAMQYNILATARRFSTYETIGGLFREVTRNSAELTITERIWGMVIDIVNEIAQCFEIEDEKIFETLINRSDKLQHFIHIYELKMAS